MAKKMLAALVAALMLMMWLVPSALNAGTAAADSNSSFILHNNEQPYYDPTAPEVPKNKTFKPSVDASIWQNVYWEIANPDSGKRLRVAEGYSVTVNYEMARPMLGQDESILLYGMAVHKTNLGEPPCTACTYHVFFVDPQYEVYPLQPPEISVHQIIEPPAGFESWADGSFSPYPSEPTDAPGALNAPPMGVQAEPVHLEVEYRYQDENGVDAGIIAPGWYLDDPEEKDYTVTFHEIAGYKATVDGADQTSYTFSPPHMSKKITVVYVPQEVSYTVKLFKENLDGSYTGEDLSGEHKAKTGSQINMQELCDANHVDGFGDPYYKEIPRVAGDGSTVAEIYLDRKYILIDFDLGEGGYGVEPIYAKFGATLPAVGIPTRTGYSFKGWKLDGETATIPATMPAQDQKYIADWEMISPVDVTVNIWGEEANTEDYELIDSNTIKAVSGQQLTQDALNAGLTEVDANLWKYEKTEPYPLPEVNPDGSTVVNVYYKRTLKTMTFNPVGSTMTKWVAGETKAEDWADGGTNSDHRPKWDEDYTWTYSQFMGGTKTVNVQALQTYLNENYPNPEEGQVVEYTYLAKEPGFFDDGKKTMHFVFHNGAWYVGEEQQVPAEPFYTITAKWGSNIADEWDAACEAGSCHNWSEKTDGKSPWTSGVRVMFDRNINYYKGSDSGGGTCQATYWGEKLDAPGEYELLYTATADGSGLNVSDEDRLQFEGYTYEKGTSNGDSYNGAKFYYTRNTYKVIYVNSPNPNHTEDAKFEQPLNQDPYNNYTADYPSNLEPGMYTFGGWYVDPSCTVEMDWTDKTMPAKNITVYAKWNPITHNVTFRPNESDQMPGTPAATVAHNALIPDSAVPTYTKTDFTFVGWFYKVEDENGNVSEHAFKPDMPVKHDMDLYAKWKATGQYSYTINYVLQGSNPDNPTFVAEPTVGIGEPGDTFSVDAKKGYSQGHPSELFWEYWQFYTPTAESQNITLNADDLTFTFYYEEDSVTIGYQAVTDPSGLDVVGGTVSVTSEAVGKVSGDGLQGSVPTANNGFKFEGWYKDEACTQQVPEGWVNATTHELTPQKTKNVGVPTTETSTLWIFEDKTYYAKFSAFIPDFTVTVEDKNVYLCGNLTNNDLLEGATAKATGTPSGFDYLDENKPGWVGLLYEVTTEVIPERFSVLTEDNTFTVTVKVKIKGTDEVESKSADGKINVFKPELTFKDSEVCYGGKAPENPGGYNTDNYVSTALVWKHGDTVDNEVEMIGTAPTLTFEYTPKAGTINDDNLVITRDDIPVKVTVKIDAADATAHVKFIHQACTNETGCGWDNLNPTPVNGDPAFLLHVKTCTLTVEKTIKDGKTYQPGESFIFRVKGDNPALPIEMEVVAHVGENGTVQSITINGLPVGSYTVTEDTGWSWRYKVTEENGVAVELKCEGDRTGTANFTNNLVSNKWLTWEAAVDNRWGKDGDDPVIVPHTKPEPEPANS